MRIIYRAHVADHGWMKKVADGEVAGTTGENRRMESILVRVSGEFVPDGMYVTYQVFARGLGWMDWVSDGAEAGTTGQDPRYGMDCRQEQEYLSCQGIVCRCSEPSQCNNRL